MLARRFATLDVLSEGRAIAGLGIGWSKDEMKYLIFHFKIEVRELMGSYSSIKTNMTDDVVEIKSPKGRL